MEQNGEPQSKYVESLHTPQIEVADPWGKKKISFFSLHQYQWEIAYPSRKKNEIGSFPQIINDISPRWIKALNMKGKIFQLREENTREYLYDLRIGKAFFNKIKSINYKRKYS